MVVSLTKAVRGLSLGPQTLQSAQSQPPVVAKSPTKTQGRIFDALADALQLFSLDVVRVVAQYKLDEMITRVDGDLTLLSPQESSVLSLAAKEVKFLDLGNMALTTKNGLQLEKRFLSLETIVERGKEWSWAEWKNTVHPVEGANELNVSPSLAWHLASIVTNVSQVFQDFEDDIKRAFLRSSFFTWYNKARPDDALLERYTDLKIHPIRHRLACLYFVKLMQNSKIERGECVFRGKTMTVKLDPAVTKSFHRIMLEFQKLRASDVAEIERLLLSPKTPDLATTVKRITTGILMQACIAQLVPQLPLSQEESAAVMKLLSLP